MRQLFIDSRDRISGTSSDFTIQLPSTLVLEGGQHQGRIDDLRIPVTVPTINASNNTITLRMGSSDYTVTIPIGQYDGPGLATAIYNALQGAVPGAWGASYNTALISMSIGCSNPFTFTGGSYMSTLLSRPYTISGNTYNFSYVPVTGMDVVYLCCKDFSNLDHVGPAGASDTLCGVPVTWPYGACRAIT